MKYALVLIAAGMLAAGAPANKAEAMPVDLGIVQADADVKNYLDVRRRRHVRRFGPRHYRYAPRYYSYGPRYYSYPYAYDVYPYGYAYPYYYRPYYYPRPYIGFGIGPFGFGIW